MNYAQRRLNLPETFSTGPMHDHFKRMAQYNAWANARLYDAATALQDWERKKDIKAYFRSLHGTLNHILVADRIWLYRLTGKGEQPASLDEILFENFSTLREAREEEDERIVSFVETLNPDALDEELDYINTKGEPRTLAHNIILTHFFNHQTHHRGQASSIMRQLGVAEPPSLDLLYYELPNA